MEVVKLAENSSKFVCEYCDYKCSKSNDMLKHKSSLKHKRNADGSIGSILEETSRPTNYDCICGKKYITHGGFWKHKKKCITSINTDTNTSTHTDNVIICDDTPSENMIIPDYKHDMNQLTCLVIEVVKNNSEFQKQMFDMCKNMQANIVSNCNNNNNNTTNNFNLQVFLNEYCKDAMNISEFVDSFDLELSDLENVGRVGYIEGISNIIINKIKDMDVNKRPIHCSDLKREIIYIKDDDVWEREDANNTKFRKVIKKVTGKNIGMLSGWQDKYPECMDIESEYNDIYIKLMQAAIGPSDTEGTEAKIMKKVLKHIVIDKKMIL